jgi:primosomal protein N' (replication factor Y)
MIWPPYCDVCVVGTNSLSRESAEKTAVMILDKIKELLETEYKAVKLIILGPSTAAVAKVNNKYRFRMIIKCKNNACFRKMLRKAIDIKTAGEVSVSVDINPETVI